MPPLFAWRDVALVQLLCAVPLALFLADRLAWGRPLAVALLLGNAAILLGSVPASISTATLAHPMLGAAFRALVALSFAMPGALAVAAWTSPRLPAGRHAFVLGLGMVALLLPPWTYVAARGRHDGARLREYLEQSRFAEAQTVANGMRTLGVPLPRAVADLDRIVGELDRRVATPLPEDASPAARLERARHLAMLDRTGAALAVLDATTGPEADNLRGTVHESRGDWAAGLEAFQRSRAEWRSQPPSPARAAGLVRATTGIAYCLRKSGRYPDAEAAYLQVLSLAPTADTHFLLARFYEDAQETLKAQAHARRAIELDPARYRLDGERLLRKLAVYHFGCLAVSPESER